MTRTTALTLTAWLCATSVAAQNPITFSTQAPGTPAPTTAPNTNPNAPPAPGTSMLSGHVFAAESGQPLRKAQVRIFAAEIRENRMATTDADGHYEFKEVRAGRYTISASKGSYVGLSYGQVRSTDPPKPLQILDNQNVERVDLSLPSGGVITGRIVDEYGEPMSDVQVGPQSYQTFQGQRRLVPTGRQASSDDMGEFRLFGISPGQYYLTATWHPSNPMNNEDRTAYAPMYFPGTDNLAQAQRITVAAGRQISDIVIALKPIRAIRVSGTAMTSEGKPMTGSVVVMSSAGYGFSMAANGPIRPDGTFSVSGLAPGEYTLRAQSFGPAGPGGESAMMKITATGEDITDLQIVGAKPSTASGRIVVDPAIASSLPPALMLMAMPLDFGTMTMGMAPGRMADDGSFELKSGPGKMRIGLAGQFPGWTIRSVRLNGSDVTDTGVEFRPNEDITGLEVEITNKVTTISGLVTNARGETLKDYAALAFAQDKDKWKIAGRYQSMGRPDQDGRFKITGLAPSDYFVIALEKIEPSQIGDPDFLESIRPKATVLTIHEGETKTVDLKLAVVP